LGYYIKNQSQFDYVSNLHPQSYPDGNDVEVMSLQALETAWNEATKPLEREHTTPFFWENTDRFRIGNVLWETGLNYAMSHRFTLDYPEDLAFIEAIYNKLFPMNPHFNLRDILDLLTFEPSILKINQSLAGVNWYRNHLAELKTISADQTKHIS
jgi:spore coat polysaccharide biosynthesis protein SpsF